MTTPPRPTREEIEHAALVLLSDVVNDFITVLKNSKAITPVPLAERLTPVLLKADRIAEALTGQLEDVNLAAAEKVLEQVRGPGKVQ